ncbi:MAG: YcbK family protein, partial [Aeromonadaceae bacterium]
WENGRYNKDGLQEFSWLFRDHRAGDVQLPIDTKLFDQLFELQRKLGVQKEIHVICGYRSQQTNAALRRSSRGVAKKSLHMSGKAVDLRIPGVELNHIRRAALALNSGGVGYYPRSNFVHLDTGPKRHW